MQEGRRARHIQRILTIFWILVCAPCLRAIEKHWIAHEAQAIVVGTISAGPTVLWFDGWYLSGRITVEEVLYGERLPHQITFRAGCKWEAGCQWWPRPHYPEFTLHKGLWFLRRVDGNTWESSNGSFDTGFRYLSDRAYWENYISLYKR